MNIKQIIGLEFYNFKNGVRLSEKEKKNYVSMVIAGARKELLERNPKTIVYHIASGDTKVIGVFFRNEKKKSDISKQTHCANITIIDSEGYMEFNDDEFNLVKYDPVKYL